MLQPTSGGRSNMKGKNGFTVIELLIVVVLIAAVFAVALPVSYGMYTSYATSLKAQDVMASLSNAQRDAFLHSQAAVISAVNGVMTVNGEKILIEDLEVSMPAPIIFYRNGSSSGGVITMKSGDHILRLAVAAPLGELSLE